MWHMLGVFTLEQAMQLKSPEEIEKYVKYLDTEIKNPCSVTQQTSPMEKLTMLFDQHQADRSNDNYNKLQLGKELLAYLTQKSYQGFSYGTGHSTWAGMFSQSKIGKKLIKPGYTVFTKIRYAERLLNHLTQEDKRPFSQSEVDVLRQRTTGEIIGKEQYKNIVEPLVPEKGSADYNKLMVKLR